VRRGGERDGREGEALGPAPPLHIIYGYATATAQPLVTSTSTYMFLPVFVCLSVSKITQNACIDLDEMDELINF